ncbi:Neutral ceramidase [Phytophthora pseudosyringae]|uniref:Neutral ceramidase n=1 Tax=Phytophthora pseudosyringae TaxID=221518 RepID=A0A8T1W2X7_9STRA|nr:Neutral ceramidase [Phytophthora pseudosyringae]
MEEPVSADDGGQQQNEAELAGSEQVGSKSASSSPETDSDGFDTDMFASMMQQELIAYNLSWDPLMKVLQALGASMAKQQRTQQSNDTAMKKMEDQVAALRGDLARAEDDKKEAAAAMEAMQNQVGEMKSQLEEILPLDGQDEQQQRGGDGEEKTPTEGANGEGDESSAVKQSPRSPRANSIGRQPFVTAKDLADAKKELRKELKKALARAFGHDVIGEADENEDDEGSPEVGGVGSEGGPRATGSPRRPPAEGLHPPGSPSTAAAELQHDLEKLQGLHDALTARMSEHDQILDTLNGRMGKLDDLSSELSGNEALVTPGNAVSTDGSNGNDGNGGESSSQNGKNGKHDELALNANDILNELKELKAVQDDHDQKLRENDQRLRDNDQKLREHGQELREHDQKLREHDEVVEKHTADIKALADNLDDLSLQQQTVASMYSGGAANAGLEAESGSEGATTDDPGKSGKSEKQAGRAIEAVSQPQLDLSLVFTKLADLRRSTDSSLHSLQQTIKGVSGTSQNQQEQLDALRNNVVFNEHLQAHLVEARLAMQKELLARNQTFQDRTKPQLVEWRKALELTEDKLLQGNSDDETLHALQQMQRCYHRTILSITPLVNSPLSISETLQTLSDEVKQLQNAIRLGVVPLRVSDYNNSGEGAEGESNKDDREEEYTRKLRYLDEEIDATLQVNITTEKKNDPLIKGLDAMREKLELLWSMWHRNHNVNNAHPSDALVAHENTSASGGDENHAAHEERRHSLQQRNPDGLREMELRLSGAVRRLAMVEEDIERLNSLTAEFNASDAHKMNGNGGSDTGGAAASRRTPSTNNLRTELVMEEMEKLRKDMYAEIAKVSSHLEGNNASGGGSSSSNSTTSLSDHRSMVAAAAKQGDVLTDLYSQMTGRELDTRLYNSPEGQKQFYDNFIKEVTKKVSSLINAEKGGPRGPGIGGAANANVNYRLLLDNFAQKVDDRLEDAREFTTEELARLRRELMEQLKIRFEVAIRDIRGELMLLQPTDGDSTAMGTKPVMCVACSRPVPVSSVIREAGSQPAETNPEPANPSLPAEFDYDRQDDEFVFRAGFKMPANDRKMVTLPFLTTAMRNKMVLNKPEGKRKRPPRQSHHSRVDNVVREAMELDRASRGRGFDAQ